MSKLAIAVAKAMGRTTFAGKLVSGVGEDQWSHLAGWLERERIAEKLIDENHIATEWEYGDWMAVCKGSIAYDPDRQTAALMAFCKHKGVAYE